MMPPPICTAPYFLFSIFSSAAAFDRAENVLLPQRYAAQLDAQAEIPRPRIC